MSPAAPRRRPGPRALLAALTAALASILAAPGGAQAIVVDPSSALGQGSSVPYLASSSARYLGLALPAGTNSALAAAGLPAVASPAPCGDPGLSSDLVLGSGALCWHGGSTLHATETFALSWDPDPHSHYAARYVEQFLKDVASASGELGSPYALTPQYTDGTARAAYEQVYGGAQHDASTYPANGCPVSGLHLFHSSPAGLDTVANDVCLTDAQLRSELAAAITASGLIGLTQPGHTPLFVLMTPPGVVDCLDPAGKVCSVNSDPSKTAAQFCGYHGQVSVDGTLLPFVVLPWTPQSACDEPDLPSVSLPITPASLAAAEGARLVSPLSRAHIAALENPSMTGWFGLDGAEASDNGCLPLRNNLDQVTIAGTQYFLQREFNNAGTIRDSPDQLACAPLVTLVPAFVVPSAINAGDQVQFDGSKSLASLIIPNAGYVWDFGDGTTATGASVVHSYAKGGTYTVALTVTDRGGNTQTLKQPASVLGASGLPVPTTAATAPTSKGATSGLRVALQLVPESLRHMLRGGVVMRVSSNDVADGIATLTVSRATARRAGLRTGRGASATIARGTVSGIRAGVTTFHLHLAPGVARRLARLHHAALTVHLSVLGQGGRRVNVVAAGLY